MGKRTFYQVAFCLHDSYANLKRQRCHFKNFTSLETALRFVSRHTERKYVPWAYVGIYKSFEVESILWMVIPSHLHKWDNRRY